MEENKDSDIVLVEPNFSIDNFDLSLLDSLTYEEKQEILELLMEREEYKKFNKLEDFKPYEFQKKFFNASKDYKARFLCAANRIGKSFSEAVEVAMHLTGDYQPWYEGHIFRYPILAWAVGITTESTMKVSQKELFGTDDARDLNSIGSGAIPKKYIDFESISRDGKRILTARIKHYTDGVHDGMSTLEFRSTQQGEHTLMGATVDYIWLDKLLCLTYQ